MIAMSSFLMNSGSSYVVDPKFPPSEEYNQSSYIPAAAGSDYYVPHQVQHYHGYHHNHQHNGHPSSVTASMGYYGQHPSHAGSNGGSYGGGAYGAPCGLAPGQQANVPMTGHVAPTSIGHHHHHPQQHQQSPNQLMPRSPAPSPTPSLTSMVVNTCPPPQQIQQQHQQLQLQHHVQQPLHQQQQLNSSHLQQSHAGVVVSQSLMQHDQLAHLGSMVAAQQSTGQQQQLQTSQIQQQQNNNALQLCQPPTPNSPESDCDDNSDDLSDDSHNPVIYPWMKKIHVAGARKS